MSEERKSELANSIDCTTDERPFKGVRKERQGEVNMDQIMIRKSVSFLSEVPMPAIALNDRSAQEFALSLGIGDFPLRVKPTPCVRQAQRSVLSTENVGSSPI